MELYLVYPQGNYIKPADSKPYLVIGEVKYGKPILDRVIKPDVSIGDASRCALISIDSTLKSDLTVGPPIDFVVICCFLHNKLSCTCSSCFKQKF